MATLPPRPGMLRSSSVRKFKSPSMRNIADKTLAGNALCLPDAPTLGRSPTSPDKSTHSLPERTALKGSMGTSLRHLSGGRKVVSRRNIILEEDFDSTDLTEQDSSSSLDIKEQRDELMKLLNHDPRKDFKVEARQIEHLIKDKTQICKEKYTFDAFHGQEIYPLQMLCALSAPLSTIKRCYHAFKLAIKECSCEVGSPLHYACLYGSSVENVKFLVSKNPHLLVAVNKKGRTPLLCACANKKVKSTDILTFLTSLFPESAKQTDYKENNPLHLACSVDRPSLPIVEFLLNNFPEACISLAKDRSTPLHKAVGHHHADLAVVKTLVKANSAAPFTVDKKGQTPIHLAILGGHKNEKVIQYLAKKFPRALSMKDAAGATPEDLAKQLDFGIKTMKALNPPEAVVVKRLFRRKTLEYDSPTKN